MKKKDLIVIGAGGHANSCTNIINLLKSYKIVGYINPIIKNEFDFNVLGSDKDLPKMVKKYKNYFIAIGQIKEWKIRNRIFLKLIKLKANLPKIISPYAIVSKNSIIGNGTIIMSGSIINSGAKIGSNCIINTGTIIEHDTIISNHCHVAPGCIVNGNVFVDEKTFIGSGSIINNNIIIGKKNVISSGSLVYKNVNNRR